MEESSSIEVSEIERNLIMAIRTRNWEGVHTLLYILKNLYSEPKIEIEIKTLPLSSRTSNALLRNTDEILKRIEIPAPFYTNLTTSHVLRALATGQLRLMRNIGNKTIAEFLDVCCELDIISSAEASDLYKLNISQKPSV